MQEQQPWLASLKTQIDELDAEIADLQNELTAQWQRLGLGDNAADDALPALSSRSLVDIAISGRGVAAMPRRTPPGKTRTRRGRRNGRVAYRGKSRPHSSARGEHDLGSCNGSLREIWWLSIAGDCKSTSASTNSPATRPIWKNKAARLVEHQLLPVGVLAGLGAAFVLGVVLILAGLFMPASITGSVGWALAVLGLAGGGAAVLGKFLLEKSRAAQLDSCQKQLAMLQSQVEQAKSEREQLDAQLPRGGGPIVSRLDAAEKDLASLEELVPLETRRNSARQQATAAAARASEAKEEYKSARRTLARGLNRFGTAEELSTRQARQLSQCRQHLAESQRRLERTARAELERRRQEWDMLTSRIAQVASDAGVGT